MTGMVEVNTKSYWYGKPLSDLTKEELIQALEQVGAELVAQRADKARWMRAADPLKYLMEKQP